MKKLFINKITIATAVSFTGLLLACGGPGTTNNDQGLAVSFLGYFSSFGQAGCATVPTQGLSGAIIPIGSSNPEPSSTITGTVSAGIDSGSNFVAVVGVQNNLFAQAFRADRLLLEYFIPGASIQPPSTTVAINLSAGPGRAATTGATAGGTTDPTNGGRNPIASALPPTFNSLCNRAYAQTFVIPASIREWLNFNRDQLPEPPFQLELTGRISGISSSGDRHVTQSESLTFSIVPETFVTPTEGTDDTGAGLVSEDDTFSESTVDETDLGTSLGVTTLDTTTTTDPTTGSDATL